MNIMRLRTLLTLRTLVRGAVTAALTVVAVSSLLAGSPVPAAFAADASRPLVSWDKAVPPANYPERVMGKADAPVTIIEYSSLTCPHCAAFHRDVLPQVKKDFIDTGKVRLVFRDFPLDRLALAGGLIARCAPQDSYFTFLDVLFANQSAWARADKPLVALKQFAVLAGVSSEAVDACLGNQALLKDVQSVQQSAQAAWKVDSTPTLVINGVVHPGAMPYAELAPLLSGK